MSFCAIQLCGGAVQTIITHCCDHSIALRGGRKLRQQGSHRAGSAFTIRIDFMCSQQREAREVASKERPD